MHPYKNIVVLGAGSAGLMAAMTFKQVIPDGTVTIVRSPKIPVIGVGQLPSSGDGDVGPNLFPTLNEIDCMLDDDKNAGVCAVWGAV